MFLNIIGASLAGYILDKDYKATNQLVKSVAGSSLKCFGDKGTPSLKILEKAIMIKIVGNKIYKKEEIRLAELLIDKQKLRKAV